MVFSCPGSSRQKRQKNKRTKKIRRQKDKIQRPKREFDIATSGQFRTVAMFYKFGGAGIKVDELGLRRTFCRFLASIGVG